VEGGGRLGQAGCGLKVPEENKISFLFFLIKSELQTILQSKFQTILNSKKLEIILELVFRLF